MSHATSDLEYFMCDMCRVYVHRDIFCPHRRECKGLGSKEMKKGECEKIANMLDAAERQRMVEAGLLSTDNKSSSVVPIAHAEKLDESRRRREIADDYARKENQKIASQLKNVDQLLAMLDD